MRGKEGLAACTPCSLPAASVLAMVVRAAQGALWEVPEVSEWRASRGAYLRRQQRLEAGRWPSAAAAAAAGLAGVTVMTAALLVGPGVLGLLPAHPLRVLTQRPLRPTQVWAAAEAEDREVQAMAHRELAGLARTVVVVGLNWSTRSKNHHGPFPRSSPD